MNRTMLFAMTTSAAVAGATYLYGQGTPVNLQPTTPGTQQVGNANISGRVIAGSVLSENSSPTAQVIVGNATATSGANFGGFFRSDSVLGRALYGRASAPSGTTSGVYGQADSPGGRGVTGVVAATTGNATGVWGQTASSGGRGVYGYNTSATGVNYGVLGQSSSPAGFGVYSQGNMGVAGNGTFSGKLGVRVTTPQAPLHVNGTSWFSGDSTPLPAAAGSGIAVGYAGSQGYLFAFDYASFTSKNLIMQSPGGSVGIGTYAPNQGRLHVDGESSTAIYATSTNGYGMRGVSGASIGVNGESTSYLGVYGSTQTGTGVYGQGGTGSGVYGRSTSGYGAHGRSDSNAGVYGQSTSAAGVDGYSGSYYGVLGETAGSSAGVHGRSPYIGVEGVGTGSGATYGVLGAANSAAGYGLYSVGRTGASGTKSFRIDHPFDPENKYLLHFATESPTPQNFYVGNVVTDAQGYAWVTLPDYFSEINKNFKYQLTIVDDRDSTGFAAAKVSKKIRDGRFQIRTSEPNVEVSWRVDADRNDLYMRNRPAKDVVDKPDVERGTYQHPEFYGFGPERGLFFEGLRERQTTPPAPASRR